MSLPMQGSELAAVGSACCSSVRIIARAGVWVGQFVLCVCRGVSNYLCPGRLQEAALWLLCVLAAAVASLPLRAFSRRHGLCVVCVYFM